MGVAGVTPALDSATTATVGSKPYSGYPVYSSRSYGTAHTLQTVNTCIPRPLSCSPRSSTVWVVFIHGGAWVDPLQDAGELLPAIRLIVGAKASHYSVIEHIAGFASINYKLSPRPGEERLKVPACRRASHPEHLEDVLAAMRWLGGEYGVGRACGADEESEGYDWVGVGHSCGATILFQLAMLLMSTNGGGHSGFGSGVKKPLALVGIAGLYDLPLLVQNHREEEYYQRFLESAFGTDQEVWKKVSPVSGDPRLAVKGARLVLLAQSRDDGLVEMEQAEVMRKRTVEAAQASDCELIMLELNGTHDELWEKGEGVAQCIALAVEKVTANYIDLKCKR